MHNKKNTLIILILSLALIAPIIASSHLAATVYLTTPTLSATEVATPPESAEGDETPDEVSNDLDNMIDETETIKRFERIIAAINGSVQKIWEALEEPSQEILQTITQEIENQLKRLDELADMVAKIPEIKEQFDELRQTFEEIHSLIEKIISADRWSQELEELLTDLQKRLEQYQALLNQIQKILEAIDSWKPSLPDKPEHPTKPTEPSEPTESEKKEFLTHVKNIQATPSSCGHVDIRWDTHPQADFYRVYSLGTNGRERTLIYEGKSTHAHDLTAVGVWNPYPINRTFNFYTVIAVQEKRVGWKTYEVTSDDGQSDYSYAQALLKLRSNEPPKAIQSIKLTTNNNGTIDLSWDEDEASQYYVVCYIGEQSDIRANRPINYYTTTLDHRAHFASLKEGYHFFRIYGVNHFGCETTAGPIHKPGYVFTYSPGTIK